jgi:cytochrome c oxidase subunit 1
MKKVLSIGMVRGILGQLLGTLLGFGLVAAIQALSGSPFKVEPAWVVGCFTGGLGFMIGLGAFRDWYRMAMGEDVEEPEEVTGPIGAKRFWSISYDHKVIGIQYGFLSLFLLAVGGSFALVFRVELAQTGLQFLSFNLFNTLVGLHGMVLISSILMGIAAISNYIIPLLIGARDMAFPRLNAFSFWVAVPGALILVFSLALGGFETGWTGYAPLSIRGPMGVDMFFLGVWFVGWSSILGALNLITTIIRMRATGMTAFRMPILGWSVLATSLMALNATQLIGLAFQLSLFERLLGMGFFDPAQGGNPILYQHLFWFYSHPAVYIFILPGLGVVSELLPVFVRKPLFGYKWVAMSSMGIALVGFLVWAHHMFAAGMEEYLRVPFMYSTLLVAVPTGVKFFSWVATIWQGRMRFQTPMLFLIGAIVIFLIGGLTRPIAGTVSTDLHVTDTYYIVGHFHATMFGGYVFPFFAALYYWFPKITGRRMGERMGKWQFWLLFLGFMTMDLGQMRIGLLGMRRRIADYDPALNFQGTNLIITLAGFAVALSVLLLFINLYRSARSGEVVTGNLWESRSPEWQIPSPTPAHNYEGTVVVTGEPYDYGLESAPSYVQVQPIGAAAPAAD